MRSIKLDAIDSTNEFLKRSVKSGFAKNHDAVYAMHQTNGKGQLGQSWSTEASKNLTCSVLLHFKKDFEPDFFVLNAAVCNAVREIVATYSNSILVEIKWPNDIMAEKKKVAGILIENVFDANNEIWTIIGVGLNLNQENFDNLPNASSLKIISKKNFDIQEVFNSLSQKIIGTAIESLSNAKSVWENYHLQLYRKGEISNFVNSKTGLEFFGKIAGVSENGKLQVLVEDEILEFANKEITMLNY